MERLGGAGGSEVFGRVAPAVKQICMGLPVNASHELLADTIPSPSRVSGCHAVVFVYHEPFSSFPK